MSYAVVRTAISESKLSDELKKILHRRRRTGYAVRSLGSGPPARQFQAASLVESPRVRHQGANQDAVTKLEGQLANSPFFPSSENVGAAVAPGRSNRPSSPSSSAWRWCWRTFGSASRIWRSVSLPSSALAHDVLFTIGCLALSYWLAPVLGFALVEPFKIDLTIVAAILTIIGYSLNDTIVIFDRIREVRGKSTKISAELINSCVNQTLSRTILTSLTVFMVVREFCTSGAAPASTASPSPWSSAPSRVRTVRSTSPRRCCCGCTSAAVEGRPRRRRGPA